MIQRKTGFSGWTNVAILFICYFLINGMLFYGFSVLFPALIKAMKWARGDAAIAHTLRALILGFTAPVVAIAINRWGIKRTILSGGFLAISGLLLLGTVTDKLWQWTLFWGVLCGLGMSATGLVPIQTNLAFWFDKNRGATMGIVTAGMSLAGVVTQPFFTWVIGETGSWQMGWMAAAGVAFVGLIGIPWLKNKPAEYGQYPDGISPEQAKEAIASGRKMIRTYRTAQPWVLKEAVRTPVLWHMVFMFSMSMVVIYFVLSHGVLHMTDLKYSKMQAAYALSIWALGAGTARIPIGWLADRIEPRWLLIGIFSCLTLAIIGIWHIPSMPLLIASAYVGGFCVAAVLVVVPIMTANYFGTSDFARINSFMLPFQICASSLIPVIAGYTYDLQKSYSAVFVGILALSILALVSSLFSVPPVKKNEMTKRESAALGVQ